MCFAIAALITSETGRSSTVATVSRASAWSALNRIVIALAGFILLIYKAMHRGCQVDRLYDTMLPLYQRGPL